MSDWMTARGIGALIGVVFWPVVIFLVILFGFVENPRGQK